MNGSEIVRPKLYVGCSLTFAPGEFKERVELTKAELRERHFDVMEFKGLTAETPEDVYQTDIIDNVGGCDGFLGIADEPATAFGYEMREANVLDKPTLIVAHATAKVSRLILGAPAFNQHMAFVRYDDMVEDVPRLAEIFFAPLFLAEIQPIAES